MKVPAELLALLRERTGLDPEILGAAVLDRVWSRHNADGERAALDKLAAGGTAWIEFLDELVVPETWLFREERSFDVLRNWLRDEWLPRHPHTLFHALSLPCATGEEAYSIAATALEAGIAAGHVRVDAGDISRRAVAAGERGFYRGRSAQISKSRVAHRYFEDFDGGLRANDTLRACVTFRTANILNAGGYGSTYPVVFCRNLLIYLTREARTAALANLQRVLAPGGLLFLGHADTISGLEVLFERLPTEGAFAFRRRTENAPTPKSAAPTAINRAPARSSVIRKTKTLPHRRTQEERLDRAKKLADSGSVSDARAELIELLRTNAALPEAWYLLGLLHAALGEMSEAESCYERTLKLEPTHPDAALHLALLVDDRGTPLVSPAGRKK